MNNQAFEPMSLEQNHRQTGASPQERRTDPVKRKMDFFEGNAIQNYENYRKFTAYDDNIPFQLNSGFNKTPNTLISNNADAALLEGTNGQPGLNPPSKTGTELMEIDTQKMSSELSDENGFQQPCHVSSLNGHSMVMGAHETIPTNRAEILKHGCECG